MSYTSGEALVLTVLRTVSGFNGAANGQVNTGQSDWGMLNNGVDVAGVVVQAEAAIAANTPISFFNHWKTIIQVWQFYVDELTTTTALQANVELVKNKFQASRHLGDNTGFVLDSNVTAIGAPEEMWKKGQDGPMWIKQDITIEWLEEQQVTYA